MHACMHTANTHACMAACAFVFHAYGNINYALAQTNTPFLSGVVPQGSPGFSPLACLSLHVEALSESYQSGLMGQRHGE